MWAKKKYHMKDFILFKKMQNNFSPMLSHQTDRFESDLLLLLYGPLEPIVINFTCDLSLVCNPPH